MKNLNNTIYIYLSSTTGLITSYTLRVAAAPSLLACDSPQPSVSLELVVAPV